MKRKLEKATHKTFGIMLALIAIPAAIAFVIVWFATGVGGKLAAIIVRNKHENEKEDIQNDF